MSSSEIVEENIDASYKELDDERGRIKNKNMKPCYYGQCCPITSLDDLPVVLNDPPDWITRVLPIKKRSSNVVQNTISDCHVEYQKFVPKLRMDKRFIPKTLVCHDYKGGYLEDKHLSSLNIGNRYTFYNWAYIDIFVYFSHHLITIPPLSWINSAHKSGVKILGTFITEFGPGSNICKEFLKDEDTMRIFATQLTQILRIFGFDGWLLNIENSLSNTNILKKFVEYLTISVHKDNAENLVIWYDSIIETGELKWQNELNNFNKCFFDRCDGIFLNYVWTEENIKKSVEIARHRPLDIYVGIDVFGRNTFGGGKFNAFKAAQIIRRYNLSMAIFAPGWTHETLPNTENANIFFENFINRDCAFWNSLWPYLYTYPITDVFETNFFTGITEKYYDISSQQQQLSKIKHPKNLDLVPNYSQIPTLNNKCNCLQNEFDSNGIRCLITKQHLNNSICFIHRLFICDISINEDVIVYYLTNNNTTKLSFTLLISSDYGGLKTIRCNNEEKDVLKNNSTVIEVNPTKDSFVIDSINRTFNTIIEHNNLSIFAYKLSVAPCNLLEIGCTLEDGKSVLLYAFGIKSAEEALFI